MIPSFIAILALSFPASAQPPAAAESSEVKKRISELKHGNKLDVANAALWLGGMGKQAKPAIPLLIELLGDDREVTKETKQGVSVPLGQPFTYEDPVLVSERASEALIQLGETAVNDLGAALGENPKVIVRLRAAETLGKIGKAAKPALPQLRATLDRQKNQKIRLEAIQAYRQIEDNPTALAETYAKALAGGSPEIRGLALLYLKELGPKAEPAIPALTRALFDKGSHYVSVSLDFADWVPLRSEAAECLGRIGPAASSALQPLTTMMRSDPDQQVRAAAQKAVKQISDKN